MLDDEMLCPNTSVPFSVVRGDILGFEIIAQAGSITNGVHPFEVSGDGTNSQWTVTVAANVITQFDQTSVGTGYTNTGTQLSMNEGDFPTVLAGTFEIQPYVHGELIDVSVVEAGSGYTSATYNYTDSAVGFTEGGYNVGGGTSTIDVDFINALDEKIEVMHYNYGILTGVVGASPYSVSAGNVIDAISFDEWGHITNITEAGVPAGIWLERDDGDSPVAMVANTSYFADVSAGTMEMRLPVTPGIGDTVTIDDYQKNSTTNNITVKNDAGGTPTIEGSVSDLIIDVDGARVVMTYVDGTYGWRYKVI